MNDGLEEYTVQFHNDIRSLSHANEAMREDTFVEQVGDILEEYGEVDSFIQCFYQKQGVKVNGYAYDYESDILSLVVAHYTDETDLQKCRVGTQELRKSYKYALNFLDRTLKSGKNWIEMSNESSELAELIYDRKNEIRGIKLILLTDGIAQKDSASADEFGGFDLTRVVWDIERFYNYNQTGEREKITIDFREYGVGPVSAVSYDLRSGTYDTYLSFIPGRVLADIYEKWGINILDLNVRVFLTARGGVNKGIRKTVLEEPEMFCAYNNGITAYSENLEITGEGNALQIEKAHDFQIINGGQTTASLYHARRKDRADLDDIMVPLKIIVISDEEERLRHLNMISQYSNTQNKVQLADLAANESPHPEIQAISNSIMAPDPTGGSQQSYWFYERARGSYEEMRNLSARTPAQKRRFDMMRPKKQKFDKIKFGKVWNTYLQQPYVVSMGGQKNFARFNTWLRNQDGEDWVAFFHKTVALLIMWDR
ncbi:MAG TPA: AIPR family protein, partial [Thermoplasmataceae archaeon]|nr:AIPR family protein [Thermoplasmataceae archaeon]